VYNLGSKVEMQTLTKWHKAIAFWSALISLALSMGLLGTVNASAADHSVSGTITAMSGSPVRHARISFKNTKTGKSVSVTSKEDGGYLAANLPPGDYQITVSAKDLRTASKLATIADADQTADFMLLPAQGGNDHLKQGANSACCDTVNSQAVGDLPLNGRSASDVAALEPGVIKASVKIPSNGIYGYGSQMTLFGSRPRQNNSRLDGISVNDYANGPLGNAIGTVLGVDALDQLSVLTRNDDAQYGRSSGGTISASTKGGTSSFHGSTFEYIRNSALDAKNYFDKVKPPFRRNQFGGSFGGPIWKGHTYFFADYEGYRESQGVTNLGPVPSEAARAGNLSTGTVTVDPVIKQYLDAFFPLPNGDLLGKGDTGIYVASGQKVDPGDHFTVRIDDKISGRDSLYGVYMFDKGVVTQPDNLDNNLNINDSREQFVNLGETHNFGPQVLNSFRFGVYRDVVNSGQMLPEHNPAVSDPSFGIVPGANAPRINVTGLQSFSGGLGSQGNKEFHWTSFQAYDDITLARGKNSFAFGVSLERTRDNFLDSANPGGQFTFNSLSDFLTNKPFSLSIGFPSATLARGIRQTVVGAYAQDEWRWLSNLSLDFGLRYEMATVPTEVNGRLSILRNLADAQPHLGSPLFSNPTLLNFEPRVGFAWDPFHDGKTVVSSGFGIFGVLPLPYEFQFLESTTAPFAQVGEVGNLPTGSFPTGAVTIAEESNSFRSAYLEPNPHRNYVMQWNFTIQRQLPSQVTMKLGYVGSRGVHHIVRVQDADIVMPTLTPQGYLWPAGGGTRINENTGRIVAAFWEGNSFYDALVLQLKRPLGRNSQIASSYTWGKSIDDGSNSMGNEYSNSPSTPLWFALRTNRGLSDFNINQDLKIVYSWQIPSPKWSTAFPTWAVSGWQLGGVFEAMTGVPFTPGIGGDPLGVNSSDPNLDVPNLISSPGCQSPVNPGDVNHYIKIECFTFPNPSTLRGNLGRNTVIGPAFYNLDFSVFKNNYVRRISDAFNVQFRSEFFNVFNHPTFSAPTGNRDIFDASGNPIGSGGLINSTQNSSRQIQFAIKFIW
jgi:Carboxypeptidase regulatory-like domain/TonB dependent receptor-like, beta-barrel